MQILYIYIIIHTLAHSYMHSRMFAHKYGYTHAKSTSVSNDPVVTVSHKKTWAIYRI